MMTEYLNPARKLVDEVVDWLCMRLEKDAAGAYSLAHLMVIVPTAQSGRELRLRLAQRMAADHSSGVLPPQIVLPMHVIAAKGIAGRQTASLVQLRAVFLKFVRERPRRHQVGERIVLDEWQTLFRSEYIADVRSHLSFFDQLQDIWRILAGCGLLMSDVVKNDAARQVLSEAVGDECVRWQALGEFESAFFEFLHARGLQHEVEILHAAKTAAEDLPESVREVVLPALADPVDVLYDVLRQQRADLRITVLVHARPKDAARFDAWGRPRTDGWIGSKAPCVTGIRDTDVVRAGTDAQLAKQVVADFPSANADQSVPALGLCDEGLFSELSAAFLNGGYELHNPERHALAASSLGSLISELVTIYAEGEKGVPWESFVAILRLDDVMSRVLAVRSSDGRETQLCRMDVLHGLDVCRNAFLPRYVPAQAEFDLTRVKKFERPKVETFQIAARSLLQILARATSTTSTCAGFVRSSLQEIYSRRTPSGDAKEFFSAAEAARNLLAQLEDEAIASLELDERAYIGLFRKALAEATYSLEPDSTQALKTMGWLELVWSAADKIALIGFNEGAVPDAVVGHAFLPDRLRTALGLVTNDRRLARDTYLLSDILAARAAHLGSVRVYVAQTNNAGDIHRPSRLLFQTAPDALAERAHALFGDLPPSPSLPCRQLVEAWRPRLPQEVQMYGTSEKSPDGRLSASAIDTWLKCPFSYLLKYGLGMKRVEEKTELEANDFGTLVHFALERYAREQHARGANQLVNETDIADSLRAIMSEIRAGYGAHPSVNMRLQLDAAEERLVCFASIQAGWAADGWRIAAEPEFDFIARPFAGESGHDVQIRGMIDRIDKKDGVGYRLIDYKTWDKLGAAAGKILKGGLAQSQHAERLHLPQIDQDKEPKLRRRFLSVQPPLYGRCLEMSDPARFAGEIADYCYVVLGATAEDVGVVGSAFMWASSKGPHAPNARLVLANLRDAALNTARQAIRRIRGNIFWPPGPSDEWKFDLKDILSVSPEVDFPMGTPWREAQEAKLTALSAEASA